MTQCYEEVVRVLKHAPATAAACFKCSLESALSFPPRGVACCAVVDTWHVRKSSMQGITSCLYKSLCDLVFFASLQTKPCPEEQDRAGARVSLMQN